eukprot:3403529-Rhodomonas_salina.1
MLRSWTGSRHAQRTGRLHCGGHLYAWSAASIEAGCEEPFTLRRFYPVALRLSSSEHRHVRLFM